MHHILMQRLLAYLTLEGLSYWQRHSHPSGLLAWGNRRKIQGVESKVVRREPIIEDLFEGEGYAHRKSKESQALSEPTRDS